MSRCSSRTCDLSRPGRITPRPSRSSGRPHGTADLSARSCPEGAHCYRFVEPGLAAECLRQADGPPAQGERRAPAQVSLFRHQRGGSWEADSAPHEIGSRSRLNRRANAPAPLALGAASANGSRRIGAIRATLEGRSRVPVRGIAAASGNVSRPVPFPRGDPHSPGCDRCCHGPGGPFSYERRKTPALPNPRGKANRLSCIRSSASPAFRIGKAGRRDERRGASHPPGLRVRLRRGGATRIRITRSGHALGLT